MPQFFVLLEITDPTVNALLWQMPDLLTCIRGRSPIHVTFRGPYETEDSRAQALELANLRSDVLRIAGVGRFSNAGEEVVYFRVDSPHLRAATWKRDFPIFRYGFEPHISVYRGRDR